MRAHSSLLLLLGAVLGVACPLRGQAPISGTIFDGSGGPLISGRVYHVRGNLTVPSGQVLTIQPGAILKFDRNGLFVNGRLDAQGTPTAPVIITSIHDDAAGGDTNGNGSFTRPAAGQWNGVRFSNREEAVVLRNAILRYGGNASWTALSLEATEAVIEDCVFQDFQTGGIRYDDARALPYIRNCTLIGIRTFPAISNIPVTALERLERNSARDCPGGAFLAMSTASVASRVRIEVIQLLGGVLYTDRSLVVEPNGALEFCSGVVLKVRNPIAIDVRGELTTRGEVVMTPWSDDAFGGDTNGNGSANRPSPGDWVGLRFHAGARGEVSGLRVRYAGPAGFAGVVCGSDLVKLHGCRVDHCGAAGFELNAAASAVDLVSFDNGGDGIQLAGGSFDLRGATATSNDAFGVVRTGRWVGQVSSSIAWGNRLTGFWGFEPGTVHHSNGSGIPGGVGNFELDPLFVDRDAGDLRLTSNSPCIDRGDPGNLSGGLDALGFPRRLDGDLDASRRVDIGAHERTLLALHAEGSLWPGSTLRLSSTIDSSVFASVLIFGTASSFELDLEPYGPLFADPSLGLLLLDWWPSATLDLVLPSSVAAPLDLVVQLVGVTSTLDRGSVSNPVFLVLR